MSGRRDECAAWSRHKNLQSLHASETDGALIQAAKARPCLVMYSPISAMRKNRLSQSRKKELLSAIYQDFSTCITSAAIE